MDNNEKIQQSLNKLNMWTVGIVVLLIIFIVYLKHVMTEHFQSRREKAEIIQKEMYPKFYKGDASYKDYKKVAGSGVDAVEYHDVKNAYKNNKFNIETLEKIV